MEDLLVGRVTYDKIKNVSCIIQVVLENVQSSLILDYLSKNGVLQKLHLLSVAAFGGQSPRVGIELGGNTHDE